MNPYIPNNLPLDNLDYKRLFAYIGEANAELARYDGLLQGIVNPKVLLSPLTTNEAVLSSKIEGTQATLDDVLEQEAGLFAENGKSNDIQEIINYRTTLEQSADYVSLSPISLFLLRQAHATLLDSVRGKDKNPGEFRKDQNWIGKYGCTMEQASFVPPSPFALQEYLEKWEAYVQGNEIDSLLQLAVLHAQFELIHPFKDGNGRIGRLLIPLFLYQKKNLATPMFYLSSYLEANREEYYARLSSISHAGDWDGWIEFFLKAIIAQAKENTHKVHQIMKLYANMKDKITATTHSQYAIQALDVIFTRPVFKTTGFVALMGISKQTSMGLLRQIREAGDLKIIRQGRGRQASILMFPALLAITEGKDLV
jgi:Fic family protein